VDVTEATWNTAVLERSRSVPVVVDFWAAWCGPCRTLGPVLEREVARRDGAVELAKVDVDANPRLAESFGVQGIPAVKAFRDGKVVAEFVGAQPAAMVARFLDSLVPSPAEKLAAAGDEASLRQALELEPGQADAAVALARILHQRGELREALDVLDKVGGSFTAAGLAARIRLELAGTPDLAPAFSALDAGHQDRALDVLISAIRPTRPERDDIRRVVVGILDELGLDNPLTATSRARLASALY
jgi:putative thioredoxin